MVNLHKHDGFSEKVAKAHAFIEEIKRENCPSCGKPQLLPISTEIGKKNDWEAKVRCEGCGVVGVFNDTGYHLELTYHMPKEVKQ